MTNQSLINCKYCNKEYPPVFDGEAIAYPDQGIRCASSVYFSLAREKWLILCGYGSDLDLDQYEVLDKQLEREIDPICDDCIRTFVVNRQIKAIGKLDL